MLCYNHSKGKEIKTKGEQENEAYSAIVKDGNDTLFIQRQEYENKAAFIHDLRKNGYKVNHKKVKPSEVFEYIMKNTNCYPWDWDINKIPEE